MTIIKPPAAVDPEKIPDGRGPDRLMSIDLVDSDVKNLFGILAEVTGKEFHVCPQIQGTITYRRTDVPWQTILQDAVKMKGWNVRLSESAVEVCLP